MTGYSAKTGLRPYVDHAAAKCKGLGVRAKVLTVMIFMGSNVEEAGAGNRRA
ncbi:hypothetical protein [Rhodobium gokarnense]|uniref:Uncharacterized protein n=1 Tax=Rhodobium gokarnense TaxID=364296 RepID=A0ABT3H9P0_9HYPH|nr:hypothetical protein [Rhodobium gokarnense]MCW2307117.1 hypothetical protein [Rhodobium gokarnense]